jgi:CubicO group peptidase (beta-lactamase class C family)
MRNRTPHDNVKRRNCQQHCHSCQIGSEEIPPMLRLLSTTILLSLALSIGSLARADADLQLHVEKTLASVREARKFPGGAILIQINGKVEAEAVSGVRASGHPDPVTTSDRWHLGSDTKAFTSTLIARLAEQRVLGFDDTLEASFPDFAAQMNPAYRTVTINQLLSHTAGLPPLTDEKELPPFLKAIATSKDIRAQRAATARAYLTMAPPTAPGEYNYSNVGYIIAGAIAEARTGKSWEQLIREQIFVPLGISNAGFGVPGTTGTIDQPRGHYEKGSRLVPYDPIDPDADNPLALGPAGTISMGLRDWMLFAQDQLDGIHGRGKLLKPETYRKLHTPVKGMYALGWGAKLGPDGVPVILAHSGSNGFWLADVRIMPKRNMIFLIALNAGNEDANKAIMDINASLRDRLKPFD